MRRLLTLSLLGMAACASQQRFYYQPEEQASARIAGRPAARYTIPPEQPRGDVRVATFGVTEIELGRGEPIPALHVRLIASNDAGERTWTLDTRDIRVQLAGRPPRGAAFVNADVVGLPVLEIPPGQSRTVDVYMPLPDDLEGAGDIPQFDVLWSVRTDERRVVERTPFERIRIEPDVRATVAFGVGVAPYGWHDPQLYPYLRPYPRAIVIRRVSPPSVHPHGHAR
jgi:hypothetical protein